MPRTLHMGQTVADVEKNAAASQLVALGVDAHIVAASLQLPLKDVQTLYAQRTEVTTRLSPEDRQLAEAMRGLAWRAYEEAMKTLEFGRPDHKQALVRLILQRSMGLVGMETTERFDELRNDFEGLLAANRLPAEGVHAELGTPPIDVDDSDEGPHHREV